MSRIIINKKMINCFLLKRSSVTLTFAFFPSLQKDKDNLLGYKCFLISDTTGSFRFSFFLKHSRKFASRKTEGSKSICGWSWCIRKLATLLIHRTSSSYALSEIDMRHWPNVRERWLDIGRDKVNVHKNAKFEQGLWDLVHRKKKRFHFNKNQVWFVYFRTLGKKANSDGACAFFIQQIIKSRD